MLKQFLKLQLEECTEKRSKRPFQRKDTLFLRTIIYICVIGGDPENMWKDAPELTPEDDRFDPYKEEILSSDSGRSYRKKEQQFQKMVNL